MQGQDGNDILVGGQGNDTLSGGDGNDTLNGGQGDDYLDGGAGNDLYQLRRGDGQDTISNYDSSTGRKDTLQFLDVASGELRGLYRQGNDLILAYGAEDQVTLKNHYYSSTYRVDDIVFSDARWSMDELIRHYAVQIRSSDIMNFTNASESIVGSANNDSINGMGGDDSIQGGQGDDYLDGGAGNDLYQLRRGDGQDTISNYDSSTGRKDTLQFLDVASGELRGLYRQGNDLILAYGAEDQVTLKNHYYSSTYRVDDIVFSDARWSMDELIRHYAVQIRSSDIMNFTNASESIVGSANNDSINGMGGDDSIQGGQGDDYLDGGAGNDLYQLRRGDGQDTISNYDSSTGRKDTLQFLDVASGELRGLYRQGNDLILAYGAEDQVTLKNHYYSSTYRVDDIVFSDARWSMDELMRHYAVQIRSSDIMNFTNASESIVGSANNDSINGMGGDDSIQGGQGDDYLDGGAGNDLYQLRRGDGQDTISNYDSSTGRKDTLQFLDVASGELRGLYRQGNDLILAYGAEDQVTLKNHYYSSTYRVDDIVFSDARWSMDELMRHYAVQIRSSDIMNFTNASESIVGSANNDSINGMGGDDSIQGGQGNDTLNGGDGNDTLNGGQGDDYLDGGAGNDLYQLRRGDGQDTISNYDSSTGRKDTLQFLDVAPGELRGLYRQGNDLILAYGAEDQVTLKNHYYSSTYRVDDIVFSDARWSMDELMRHYAVQIRSSDIMNFTNASESIVGSANNDSINGMGGDDSIQGGQGDDYLDGGAGNDLYQLRRGDGQDTISNYDSSTGRKDTLQFLDVASGELRGLYRQGNDLILAYGAEDQVTLKNHYYSSTYRVDDIVFSDARWSMDELMRHYAVQIRSSDIMNFTNASESIVGSANNDSINGMGGDDSIQGGQGDDYLDGGAGNDLYQLRRGDGQDTISNYDSSTGRKDTLQFLDVASGELRGLYRQGNDLILAYGAEDQVTLKNHYYSSTYRVDDIVFSDARWSMDELMRHYAVQIRSSDIMNFTNASESIVGSANNDSINGMGGDDSIQGGQGNDTLNGGDGNDTLNGGQGDDYLDGGAGNDLYQLRRGDGQDTISNYDSSTGRKDTLQFLDVAPGELRGLYRQGNDLILAYGAEDQVTLKNHYYSSTYRVDDIVFSDARWSMDELMRHYAVQIRSSDIMNFTNASESIVGSANNDSINGMGGDDSIQGGQGDDYLDGGAGNDLYQLRRGDGQDTISNYDSSTGRKDTLQFLDVASGELRGLYRQGNDLILAYGAEDQVTLKNHYYSSTYRVDDIVFSDARWSMDELMRHYAVQIRSRDIMNFTNASESIVGSANNDSINGMGGDDSIQGGQGDDYLDGGAGNDLYQLRRGDGQDTISNYDSSTGRKDTLQFLDVASGELRGLYRQGNDLILAYGAEDQVTLKNHYYSSTYRVDDIVFSDARWSMDELMRHYAVQIRSSDIMNFTNASESIVGSANNDSINGMGGDDSIQGGQGNDTLNGGDGNDTYLFRRGDGVDLVQDSVGQDELAFDQGVNADQLWFRKQNNSLEVSVIGSGDKVVVDNWFGNAANQLETIRSSDGKTLAASQVQALVTAMAAFNPPAAGQMTLPADYQAALQPVIASSWK
nr:calcium-binding protein [Chromobacterium sp. IIBBL 290-4]